MKKRLTSRRFRHGAVATAITAVVVALTVVVNALATAITDKYSLTLDLTEEKVFSLSQETEDYLAGLDKDVELQVLSAEDSFESQNNYLALEILRRYALASPRIQLTFTDLMTNPALIQEYPDLQLSTGTILVKSGDEVRDVTLSQFYDIQYDYNTGQEYVAGYTAEQALTEAVLAVTSEERINVAILVGHGEESVANFEDLLRTNNYAVDQVNILTGDLDPIYDVVLIVGPTVDYNEEELRRLDKFLQAGGQDGGRSKTLFYFSTSDQADLPGLAAFLEDWGVEIGPGLVYETDPRNYMPNDQFMAVVDYADTQFGSSADLAAKDVVPLTAYSRPVSLRFDQKDDISTRTLLQFADTAGVVVTETTDPQPGGVVIPHLTLSQKSALGEAASANVVVGGSTALLNQQFLEIPNLGNSRYLLGLVSGLSGREEPVQIQSKSLAGKTLGINNLQAILVGLAVTVAFPLALLIFGLVIWARRRHR